MCLLGLGVFFLVISIIYNAINMIRVRKGWKPQPNDKTIIWMAKVATALMLIFLIVVVVGVIQGNKHPIDILIPIGFLSFFITLWRW